MSKKKRRGRGKAPRADASLEVQMAKLKVDSNSSATAQNEDNFDDDAFLNEAIKLAAAEGGAQWINGCDHGRPSDARVLDFVRAFESAFTVEAGRSGILTDAYLSAHAVTSKRYADVMFDSAKVKMVVSYFLSEATEAVVGGYNNNRSGGPGWYASFVCYFEHHIADGLRKHKIEATSTTTQMFELHNADNGDRALISFLKKRISCSCLDNKYKEVKCLPKMGLCYNDKCPLYKRKAERSTMFYCTQCGINSYCSPECQKAHWPDHKFNCNLFYLQRQREGENSS